MQWFTEPVNEVETNFTYSRLDKLKLNHVVMETESDSKRR